MKTRKPKKRKRSSRPKSNGIGILDDQILERSDTVLWTIAPPGIVLHNFARRKFLQLDAKGYAAWGFLDGARTVREVIDRCCVLSDGDDRKKGDVRQELRDIVQTLAENEFVVERSDV
jgi:hypothetical protein